ncbi:MAG: protein kinase [Verrucomicrobiaceae bacterium]|nr:protein kinase [Verrucomicrobiaceae bacterium]
MNAPQTCPKCGSTLAPDAPEGLCPACLMAGALPTDATIKLTPSQMRTPPHGPVAPAPEELAPLFPQLEIIELLGRGGMGAVYKARQPKLNRFVALKIIAGDAAADPHFAERFQREAQALAKLNHPNIVSVFDFGMVGPRRTEDSPPHLYYFLMEFVDGANLRAMMQSGEMRPEAALALIPAFCDALQYAHDEGVVHRDIKPENVLVDKKGRVKIADFGLAKLTGGDAHDHTLTRTGMHLGTPRYMAPEQVEKPETVDHRADIYSLGVVFYEMLTGELPMGRFDPPSKKVDVDVKLDDIVLRSLEKEPARRYQHASEIKSDVQSVAGSATANTPPAAAAPLPAVAAEYVAQPRLSRMALIGAIWGLFGLIAVIPSVLLTKTVAFSQGKPSSLIYEPPPLAFTIFMGVLLCIGAGAPIGTTILGAISMSNIKKSGGKLHGLPLAFADTVFFPMLLLHGAMAVALGLLILTIMKLAGVNAGLGALEMGLLAMLPLIADFFIVRSLWRKMAGRAATVHSTHETPAAPSDVVKKPRKRHLLTTGLALLFFTAFIFGIDFRGSSVMTAGGRNSNAYVGAFDPWFVYEGTSKGFHHHLQPFSWSFFALVVAGITFGALWRVGREDDAKVPRDPAWWRDWWKQVGIWGGLLLIACVIRTAKDPQKVLQPITSSAPLIVAEKTETRETDHYLCRYKISAPPDHRVAVWLETTREGKPVVLPGLKDQVSFAEQHETGEAFDGHVEFSLMNGSRISPDSKGRWRWDFKFDSGKGRFTPGGWIDNPFDGKAGVIMDRGPERWQPKPGETVSLMVIRAGREFSGSDFTQQPPGGEVELRLKARIDLVPLFHRRVSGLSSTSTEPDALPETPLGRIAAGFEIDTKLPDDETRRALIEKLKTNPSKRADAEAILKSVGTPITKEATPEDVLKALEEVVKALK